MTKKKFFAMLLIALSVLVVASTVHAEELNPPASGHTDTTASHGAYSGLSPSADSSRIDSILSIVRMRSDDPRILGQIRHKLLAISGERLLMISSLSDRIIAQAGEPGTDVAYLLLTSLIILS